MHTILCRGDGNNGRGACFGLLTRFFYRLFCAWVSLPVVEAVGYSLRAATLHRTFLSSTVQSSNNVLGESRLPHPPARYRFLRELPQESKQWYSPRSPPLPTLPARLCLLCAVFDFPPNGNGNEIGLEQSTPGGAADIFLSRTAVLSPEECRAVIRAAEEYSQVGARRAARKENNALRERQKERERERERRMEIVEMRDLSFSASSMLRGSPRSSTKAAIGLLGTPLWSQLRHKRFRR